jgi:hypothetical protein
MNGSVPLSVAHCKNATPVASFLFFFTFQLYFPKKKLTVPVGVAFFPLVLPPNKALSAPF